MKRDLAAILVAVSLLALCMVAHASHYTPERADEILEAHGCYALESECK